MNKHLWLSSTKAPSAGCLHAWLHAVGDPRIRPQVEPDKVSLCQAEVMNLSPPSHSRRDSVLTWSRVALVSRIKVREIAGRWSVVFLWKVIRRSGATPLKARRVRRGPAALSWNKGLFAESVPGPAWLFSLSKDFWNVSCHAKFMLNHNRNPSHNREQH